MGNQFLICGEGLQAEGMPSLEELSIDIPSKRVGQFRELIYHGTRKFHGMLLHIKARSIHHPSLKTCIICKVSFINSCQRFFA